MHKNSKPLCAAPWTHQHQTSDGYYSLCCHTSANFKIDATSAEEAWNHPKVREIRAAMLNKDVLPAVCKACNVANSIYEKTPLHWMNVNAVEYGAMNDLADHTALDGTYNTAPLTLDIRTDMCNLTCRTCYSVNSTAIQTGNALRGIPIKVKGQAYNLNPVKAMTDEQLLALKEVYWAGGEPFMSPVHWEVMDRLVKLDHTTLKVRYNTNATFPGNTFERASKLLKKFSRCTLYTSLDGVGPIGEYIREGLDVEQFFINVRKLREACANVTVLVDLTLTSLGMLNLPELITRCAKEDLKISGKIAAWDEHGYINYCILRPDVFDEKLKEARLACDLYVNPAHRQSIASFLDFIEKKYTPSPFKDRNMLDNFERRWGKIGFFDSHAAGKYNVAT